jgi:uncharacterized protein
MRQWRKIRIGAGLCGLAALLAGIAAAATDDAAYRSTVEKWRQHREESLKSDDGWLTVAGLFWLHDGFNNFGTDPLDDIVLPAGPAQAGTFEFHAGKTTVHANKAAPLAILGKSADGAALRPDQDPKFDEKTDQVTMGALTFYVHQSGQRYAIRLQDRNSQLRRQFTGLRWFPIDPAYRVEAKYVPYDKPKIVQIQNMMGDFEPDSVPGFVEFELNGQKLRLDVDIDGNELSIVFRDLTSGRETYGAARFLVAPAPKDGKATLDFNEAYNPPCAYNPYTTCPLPTPENRLRVRIAAGEMTYHGPHGP